MKDVHFYSSKINSIVMLGISSLFILFFVKHNLDNTNLFIVVMLRLCFVLCILGVICSLLLLLRQKPMLTVTDQQIIIYNLIRKPKVVHLNDISSFHKSKQTHRGVKTGEHIHMVLKAPSKNIQSFQKRSSDFFPYYYAVINLDILNVKTTTLLELLNSRLVSFKKHEVS